MSTPQWPSKVIPAQLAFLAIYNPSLSASDETFRDQLVFYYSRAALDSRIATKKNARNDAAGGDALRAEENEKLRQIGLAQGMVDFAKTFSSGEPVDSIETEKSRIVLYELEKGWWILASVDLTRLPSISQSTTSSKNTERADSKTTVEYSSREVSPPALLIQQLLQAHYIFSLHHGPSLSDLFVRLTRERFCSTLDRFWTRFARSWDVLLHGNPAADAFSGIKLASGGELGFGVGEEEWGSGEREVLEDLARRTEGLVDLVVARFGEPASVEDRDPSTQDETLPWMGSGDQPLASDGVIFGGIGGIQRHSLRDVSLWMRQIYAYGEHAYGVKDNPLRERRKRKRREPPASTKRTNSGAKASQSVESSNLERLAEQDLASKHEESTDEQGNLKLSADRRPEIYPRVASQDYMTTPEATPTPPVDEDRPNIPPPIVSAAELSLRVASRQADEDTKRGESQESETTDEASTTLGIPDQYMKYLTFGLSTLGKPKRPPVSRQDSMKSTKPSQHQYKDSNATKHPNPAKSLPEEDETPQSMAQVDPIPDGEVLKSKLARKRRQENRGHFVIGLKGDLLELDELSSDEERTENLSDEGSMVSESDGSRIVLRTVQVEIIPRVGCEEREYDQTPSKQSSESLGASLGDDVPSKNYHRLRVLLYVHRPFMYCFLFKNRTVSLAYTKFYKLLHRNLVPIHKPLLSSTSVTKVAERIENSHAISPQNDSGNVSEQDANKNKLPSKFANTSPIYDLIYDPQRLTLHTSIPNIPEPGTPAAEGIFPNLKIGGTDAVATTPAWTRIEALNVHSQILSTLASVKHIPSELERTSKTNRGWWIVWMKVPSSDAIYSFNKEAKSNTKGGSSVQTLHSTEEPNDADANDDKHRIAFLVRKASSGPSAPKSPSASSKAVSSMLEVMSLGMAGRDDETTSTTSDDWGPAALAGGIGIDSRKYIEGLLSLNR